MANHLWIRLYPSTYVEYVPIIGSYNVHSLVDTHGKKFHKYNNFKFETKWLLEDSFFDIVRSIWSTDVRAHPLFNLLGIRICLNNKKNGPFRKKWDNLSLSRNIYQEIECQLMNLPSNNDFWM